MRIRSLPPAFGAAAVVALCAALLYFRYPGNFPAYENGPPGDFEVYLRAWERLQSGQNPYVAAEYSAYKYSPGVLALVQFLPSAPVDAWFVFSCLCIAAFSIALLIGARYRSWGDAGRLFGGLGLAWKGIIESLDYGQIEIFIFSIAVYAAALFAQWSFLSGVLIGFLPWLKLPWILLVLPFVLGGSRLGPQGKVKPPPRRMRLFVSGYVLSSFFWGAAVPSLAYGPERAMDLSQDWLAVIRQQPQELFFSDINQSIWVSFARFFGGNTWLALAVPCLVAAVLMGLLMRRRSQAATTQDSMSWISPWMIFTQILNPLSWRWGSVYLAGSLFAMDRSSVGSVRMRRVLWGCVALLWLAQLNPVVQSLGLHHWTDLHAYGIVTAYWIAVLLLAI